MSSLKSADTSTKAATARVMEKRNLKTIKVFTVPGLHGSGLLHWQTMWETQYGYSRVEQENWERPVFANWKNRLIQIVNRMGGKERAVLIAHSLGCLLVVKCLPLIRNKIAGAFLVAPPDLASPAFSVDLSDFSVGGAAPWSISGCVVYSEDDPYASVTYSEKFARTWGLLSCNAGRQGHINAESDLGEWKEGHELFKRYLETLRLPVK
jgi:predicted alpha/beta hydrolase family esterase